MSFFTELEIAFVMNATSEIAKQAFKLMRKSTKYVMYRLKSQPVKYQFIVHGEGSSSGTINFKSDPVDFKVLSDNVDGLKRDSKEDIPALHKDLEKVREAFKSDKNSPRQHAEKVGDVLSLLTVLKLFVFGFVVVVVVDCLPRSV